MATVAATLAGLIVARRNSIESGTREWIDRHTAAIRAIERELLPSGAGIDQGTDVDLDRSRGDCLVLRTNYHHMNASGHYDGWTRHTIRVRPTFHGIEVTVGGVNRNDIKDYLADVFNEALSRHMPEDGHG